MHPDGLGEPRRAVPDARGTAGFGPTPGRTTAAENAGQPIRASGFHSSSRLDKASTSKTAGAPLSRFDDLLQPEAGKGAGPEGLAELRVPDPGRRRAGRSRPLSTFSKLSPNPGESTEADPFDTSHFIIAAWLTAQFWLLPVFLSSWKLPKASPNPVVRERRSLPVSDLGNKTVQAKGWPETWELYHAAESAESWRLGGGHPGVFAITGRGGVLLALARRSR